MAPVGLVRAGLGATRGGHGRTTQAGVRLGSSLQDQPPFRLADPALGPRPVPDAGPPGIRTCPGLAAPRSLAVLARRVCPGHLARTAGRPPADSLPRLAHRGA